MRSQACLLEDRADVQERTALCSTAQLHRLLNKGLKNGLCLRAGEDWLPQHPFLSHFPSHVFIFTCFFSSIPCGVCMWSIYLIDHVITIFKISGQQIGATISNSVFVNTKERRLFSIVFVRKKTLKVLKLHLSLLLLHWMYLQHHYKYCFVKWTMDCSKRYDDMLLSVKFWRRKKKWVSL